MTGMLTTELDALLDDILRSRRLLAHPFYRRWEAGTLGRGELASYAAQYRYFEAALPVVLERIADALPDGRARGLVVANLEDERAVPAPHLELFDAFAGAVGATATDMTPATDALVGMYMTQVGASPVAGLSAVAAYDGTRFWDVHAGVDEAHGAWMLEALGAVAAGPDEVSAAATAAADAWWAFLDEREAAAVVSVAG